MIPTFRFQNLKCCRGNCMRLLRRCTRYGALHPISGHYTRSERVQCSLIGCTPSSTTSSVARRATGSFNTDAGHAAPHHFTGPRSPTRATTAHPMRADRRVTMTVYVSIRQSADPLSKNSRKSKNFGEWVCCLADEPTGHHHAHTRRPTCPSSSNQNDRTQACYQVVLHHLAGYYTSSELV